ncbi:hypothetical protein NR996_03020 [Lactobacillus rodentium]|uniref:Uncharacterized protein n=1 Tax=Lactobacillus rodentium TaxID=947835 RepID=A0A2Z6TEQ4_9LACO|nr:hypothetical protein [Lactobacillus rodentium]MCR1894381.1 hypothetical protein [Lactobacillus rodentium]GBG04680.1 hypothetical protein LrDSM24759_05940 [Lactobacillus rodentium]
MTEKRAQYRKQQRQDSVKRLLKRAQTNKDSLSNEKDDLNVNPDFTRDRNKSDSRLGEEKILSSRPTTRVKQKQLNNSEIRENKIKRLKNRLNLAIIIVLLLIVLVFVALFNL